MPTQLLRSSHLRRVLLVDNHDSFTWNLAQAFEARGAEVTVWRNDAFQLSEAIALRPSHVVISPGPGDPSQSGRSGDVVRHFLHRRPILGVCLGHQLLVQTLGGSIGQADPVHGKATEVHHDGTGLFRDLPNPMRAGRYHSLVATEVPETLEITARSADGAVMGVRLTGRPVYGVQFHPESILTPHGGTLLSNFLGGITYRQDRFEALSEGQQAAVVKTLSSVLRQGERGLQGRVVGTAWDGAVCVGLKAGNRKGTTFESALGAVLPGYRGQGIARRLLRDQHTTLQSLLSSGGCIKTQTLNVFRGMLLLNLQEGFVITQVTPFKDPIAPYIHLEKRLDLQPTEAEEVEGDGRFAFVPHTANTTLIALLKQGYDIVGTRIGLQGLLLVLDSQSVFGPETYIQPD